MPAVTHFFARRDAESFQRWAPTTSNHGVTGFSPSSGFMILLPLAIASPSEFYTSWDIIPSAPSSISTKGEGIPRYSALSRQKTQRSLEKIQGMTRCRIWRKAFGFSAEYDLRIAAPFRFLDIQDSPGNPCRKETPNLMRSPRLPSVRY